MNLFNRRFFRINADIFTQNSAFIRIYLRFIFSCFVFAFITFTANHSFGQETLEILAQMINRGNTEQKRDALFQIRNIKTPEASLIAVPALRDSAEIIRATAAYSVIFLPPNEAVQALLPNLRDKSVLVRRETAYALGEVKSANATNPLLQILQGDKDLQVREAAAVSMGKVGDVSAVEALVKILSQRQRDNEEFLRRASARSIGQIAQIIQTNQTNVRTPESFSPEINPEIQIPNYLYLNKEFPVFLTAAAVLIKTLQNPREAADVKRETAFALGEIGNETAIPILRSNLNSEDYYLAKISEEALKKLLFIETLRRQNK